MAQKHTYEYVKNIIEKEGYQLISKEYINNLQKLKMICPEGHECEIAFGKFISGRRCKICSKEGLKEKLRLSYEEVKQVFKEEGYELLVEEYSKANKKLQYKCPNGHIHEMSYNSFQQGHRCPECQKTLKFEYEDVKLYFENHGFILLSKQYKRANDRLEYICPNGHKHYASWTHFRKNPECPICNNKVKNIDVVKENMAKEGYILKSEEYNHNREKLHVQCPKGHEFEMTWHEFNGGCRCPQCGNNYKGEKRISEVLVSNNILFVPQKRFKECKDIQPLPFDFYLPNYNLCIEYDGEGHYMPIDFKGKGEELSQKEYEIRTKHDIMKTQYCKDNNIKLVRIPYWNFNNIENILKQELSLE